MVDKERVLVFLASRFPGPTEDTAFIQHEIRQLSEAFDKVLVFSFVSAQGERFPLPDNVEYVGALSELPKKGSLEALLAPALARKVSMAIVREFRWSSDAHYRKLTVGNALTGARFALGIQKALAARGLEDSDVTVYSFWAANSALALPFLPTRYPKVFRMHGHDLYDYLGLHLPLRASLFASADKVLPISEAGEEHLRQRFHDLLDLDKVEVLRLGTADGGVRPKKPTGTGRPIEVVSCSSVNEGKRVGSILEALQLASATRPVSWSHFGSGPLSQELLQKVEASADRFPNLRVDLRGHVPNEDVLAHYAQNYVDVFVNLSDSEGVPVAVMEALSFGIPVVATDVGGTSEIVGEEKGTGVLVRRRPDPHEVVSAIDRVLEEEQSFDPRAYWSQVADASITGQQIADLLSSPL